MRTPVKVGATLGVGILLSVAVGAAPAFADGAYCQISGSDWSCQTSSIQANSSHKVRYNVHAASVRCYWVVRAVIDGVAVGAGSTTTATGAEIPGLYSRYRLELSSGSQRATLCYGVISS